MSEPVHPEDHTLKALVAPTDWVDPVGTDRYNLVVIGGGTAGLVAAIGSAGLGAKVALIERASMGGDCLNTGCVPSKALIRCARAAWDARRAKDFGVTVGEVTVDFPAVMQRMRVLRAGIAENDSFARVKREGVDTFRGDARFVWPDAVEVGGRTLRFARAVIATGARPRIPDIPGITEIDPLTSDSVWDLDVLPARLLVLGGGPIGCELAQCFARFGARTTIVSSGKRLLERDDPEASWIVRTQLEAEGLTLHLGVDVVSFAREGDERVARLSDGTEIRCDAVLLAVGREPRLEGLGLDVAGVAFGPGGVEVDDFLRTSNPAIYASGDVAGKWAFTHAADAMSRLVIRNALFFGRARASALHVPWVTYTDPEVAHVGATAEQAAAMGAETVRVDLRHVDRAIVDGETEGYATLHVFRGRILGGTIVARHAGDLIGEVALAVSTRVRMQQLANVVHPYPTTSEVLRKAADTWNRGRYKPWMRRFLGWFLSWRR